MKKYPTFKRGEVQKVFLNLSKKNRDIIGKYISYVSITSKSRVRLENNKRNLTEFCFIIDKNLDNVSLSDLRGFLSLLNSSFKAQSSRNDLKHTIKRFLRWYYKDWSERFDNLNDIKLIQKINEEKINSSTLLKKNDIEKIMKAEPTLFWKTFFISLYESGLRPIELRTLLWSNVKFDIDSSGLTEFNIFATKTSKARSVFVKESTFYLKKMKEESSSLLVFPSFRDKNKPMTKNAPAMWLKRISLKVLGRPVHPYLLRHSRATELYINSGIPDKTAQKFLGHGKSMSDVYTHLSSDDVRDAVSKTIYNLEYVPPEKKKDYDDRIKLLEKEIFLLQQGLKFTMEKLDSFA